MLNLKKINNSPLGLFKLGYELLIEPKKYISIIIFNEILNTLMIMCLFLEISKI